jgi:hypothetical protein
MAVLAVQVHAQSFLTNGLAAYYPLSVDGSDQSGHGLDLTLNNVVFSSVGPASGMRPAASFDGQTSYGTVAQTLIVGQANWTWAAWLYAPQPTTSNPWPSLYQEGSGGGPCFGIDLTPAEVLHFGAWNVAYPNNWMFVDLPYGLTNGWSQLVLTLADGGVGCGTCNVFFNGVLTNTVGFQSTNPGDSSPRFGMVGNGWSAQGAFPQAPWAGSMANLRFYNRALSVAEVQALYQYELTPSPLPCIPSAATATATVVDGFVVSATITDGGNCYTNTPVVRIIDGGGSGAQAVAVVSNGVVTAVSIVSAGSGYTGTPVIVIAPPFMPQPTMSITALLFGPLVPPVIELDLAHLSPYDNYQLQFTPVLGGTWTNLGMPFTPTSTNNTQYISGVGESGFVRVKYLP